jgi:hypothetical protein
MRDEQLLHEPVQLLPREHHVFHVLSDQIGDEDQLTR